jgi:hypothetical protein
MIGNCDFVSARDLVLRHQSAPAIRWEVNFAVVGSISISAITVRLRSGPGWRARELRQLDCADGEACLCFAGRR